MTDWWSSKTNTYPPLTPINCKFFFVEGDPGSPSAFRFIIDLREDCGDEAGKDIRDHTQCRSIMCSERVRTMVKGLMLSPVTCLRALLGLDSLCGRMQRSLSLCLGVKLITGRANSDDRSCYRYWSGQLALEDITYLLGADRNRQLNWGICETDTRLIHHPYLIKYLMGGLKWKLTN